MTLKTAIDKLIICDDCLIFKTSEPAFIERHGSRYERKEANLFNLMNQEFIPDVSDEYSLWFREALDALSPPKSYYTCIECCLCVDKKGSSTFPFCTPCYTKS